MSAQVFGGGVAIDASVQIVGVFKIKETSSAVQNNKGELPPTSIVIVGVPTTQVVSFGISFTAKSTALAVMAM